MPGPAGSGNDDWTAADGATGTYVVADGVGSARHGGWSARFVVERLPALLASTGDPTDPELVAAFLRALSGDLRVRAGNRLGGIGTTVVAAVVRGDTATIAHVGDSRAYLSRAGRLARLTTDHALGESLVATGILDAGAAARLPGRSRLTQHIGMAGRVEPAVRTVELLPSDRLLMCSDGLTAVVDDATIATVLASVPAGEPSRCCDALLAAAAARGLVDDTTVLVIG
ncbi:PP2C family protein-serine/threonine phosphatase [Pseudonocardia adelaidensis]